MQKLLSNHLIADRHKNEIDVIAFKKNNYTDGWSFTIKRSMRVGIKRASFLLDWSDNVWRHSYDIMSEEAKLVKRISFPEDQPFVVPPSRWAFAFFPDALLRNFPGHLLLRRSLVAFRYVIASYLIPHLGTCFCSHSNVSHQSIVTCACELSRLSEQR